MVWARDTSKSVQRTLSSTQLLWVMWYSDLPQDQGPSTPQLLVMLAAKSSQLQELPLTEESRLTQDYTFCLGVAHIQWLVDMKDTMTNFLALRWQNNSEGPSQLQSFPLLRPPLYIYCSSIPHSVQTCWPLSWIVPRSPRKTSWRQILVYF